jgi:hypothetical protein
LNKIQGHQNFIQCEAVNETKEKIVYITEYCNVRLILHFVILFNLKYFFLKNGLFVDFVEKIKFLKKNSKIFYLKNYEELCQLVIKWILEITIIYYNLLKDDQQKLFSREKFVFYFKFWYFINDMFLIVCGCQMTRLNFRYLILLRRTRKGINIKIYFCLKKDNNFIII